jgi:flagellar protein FlaG
MQVGNPVSIAGLQTTGAEGVIDAARGIRPASPSQKNAGTRDKTAVDFGGNNTAQSEIEKSLADMRQYEGWGNFNIGFSTDQESGSLVIQIVDRETKEVLRQIPPDEILALKAHLKQVVGLVFDRMA